MLYNSIKLHVLTFITIVIFSSSSIASDDQKASSNDFEQNHIKLKTNNRKLSIAVVLSGCGHLDGAEIFETVFTLLELDKHQTEVQIFAPNIKQRQVINHLTQEIIPENRNVLVESARISRGQIKNLSELQVQNFDALILPGGFGAALNLSDLAVKNEHAEVIPQLQEIIIQFYKAAKPIGAICISPALLALTLKEHAHITITLGNKNDLIQKLSATEQTCLANNIVIDKKNKIVTTPAFMLNAPLAQIYTGISALVAKVIEMCIKNNEF